ncbi:4-hydroxy-3-methylbut-2-enyl diphosphate reductase [Anopheles sinensis]|uniref:4-hydroxy-3-methylbut-2-enyl diphosphate reductase n=1 Tax=Anopheles sinensis TaxID=74873 RepID=A0A084W2P9_ANOSI|nr:4-hydroxy-3-methylbut-2-enyl diphosphate reductase [Anopheles sinensis]
MGSSLTHGVPSELCSPSCINADKRRILPSSRRWESRPAKRTSTRLPTGSRERGSSALPLYGLLSLWLFRRHFMFHNKRIVSGTGIGPNEEDATQSATWRAKGGTFCKPLDEDPDPIHRLGSELFRSRKNSPKGGRAKGRPTQLLAAALSPELVWRDHHFHSKTTDCRWFALCSFSACFFTFEDI